MTEIQAIPTDGMYIKADEGGVVVRFTRRMLAGVEPTCKEHPDAAVIKEGVGIVAEVWMTKETAFALRKTLNEVLSGKPLAPPKEPERPKGYE